MGQVAYALRDEFTGTVEQVEEEGAEPVTVPKFTGGLINIGADDEDGDLNVREALDEGDGIIVVDDRDPRVTAALDSYAPLKRVEVPENAQRVVGDYDDQGVTALRAELKERGITGAGNVDKGTAVTALKRVDEAATAGDPVPVDTHISALFAGEGGE